MSLIGTAQNFIIGQDVEVVFSNLATGATSIQRWEKIAINFDGDVARFKPAPSTRNHWRIKTNGFKLSMEGYVGGAETLAELPQRGTEIQSIAIQTITEGADLVPALNDEVKYGKVGVQQASCDVGEDKAGWKIEAESGFEPDLINP